MLVAEILKHFDSSFERRGDGDRVMAFKDAVGVDASARKVLPVTLYSNNLEAAP